MGLGSQRQARVSRRWVWAYLVQFVNGTLGMKQDRNNRLTAVEARQVKSCVALKVHRVQIGRADKLHSAVKALLLQAHVQRCLATLCRDNVCL